MGYPYTQESDYHECWTKYFPCGCFKHSCTEQTSVYGKTYKSHDTPHFSYCNQDFCDIRGCRYPDDFKKTRNCCSDYKCDPCTIAYKEYKEEKTLKYKLGTIIDMVRNSKARHSPDGANILCDFCLKEKCQCLTFDGDNNLKTKEKIDMCKEFIKRNHKWRIQDQVYGDPIKILCVFCNNAKCTYPRKDGLCTYHTIFDKYCHCI